MKIVPKIPSDDDVWDSVIRTKPIELPQHTLDDLRQMEVDRLSVDVEDVVTRYDILSRRVLQAEADVADLRAKVTVASRRAREALFVALLAVVAAACAYLA